MVAVEMTPPREAENGGISPFELLSPLFLAVPTPRVNELLGTLGEFVKQVQAEPTEGHRLVLSSGLVALARDELSDYQQQSLVTLEQMREGLDAPSGLQSVSTIISQKEPESWSTKVARRLLSKDQRDWVKDIHRIALVVDSDSDLIPTFVAMKSFIEAWTPRKEGLVCAPYFGSLKGNIPDNQLAAQLKEFAVGDMPAASRWEGIKGVAYFQDMLLEFQIKTKGFVEREKDSNDPASHAAHKARQEEQTAEHAERFGLPPHFVPFLANLIQRTLVDPKLPPHPFPRGISVTLSDEIYPERQKIRPALKDSP